MEITQITYGITINVGNYENKRIEATAQLEHGETADDVFIELRRKVLGWADLKVKREVDKT